ncbi:hypothetical protein BZG35_11305 [Brevundimonas sp. LM2]|uniref:hypothetical protein n=1 Tax=Brevundimonas sp. LM2 TaxID=1938605 RepID=UPI000983B39F|nr:hypothetical protein [Brevundimonas sp. LM2]AQR62166.1 hypothetical protein BZG35_11305 [Brevundimonas sp. LM2]
MQREKWTILAFATLMAVVAATALAQVNQAAGRGPTETTLQPSRVDAATLAAARQNPLANRLRIALANDPNYERILGQAQRSAVPVLVPPNPGLVQTARFYPGDRQYTLVVRPPGQIVEILGSTRALQPPEGTRLPPPEANGRAAAARITRQTPLAAAVAQGESRGLSDIRTERTEYGVDVSFVRFGALYSVTFVCDDQTSLECSNAAAVQFASQLELIGGGQ